MVKAVVRKQKRTNIYVVDEGLYAWAQYRAKLEGYDSVSEYLFDLIKGDKEAFDQKESKNAKKQEKV